MRATDAVVPHHHALPLHTTRTTPGQQSHGSPLYRVPWKPRFNSAFPPIAIGIALANLDALRDHVAARVNAFSGQAVRHNAAPSIRLAEAAAQVDAASQPFRRDANMLAASASSMLRPLSAGAQAQITYNAACVIDACSHPINRGTMAGRVVEGRRHYRGPSQRWSRCRSASC